MIFRNLKAGDKVIVSSIRNQPIVDVVERVTKTHIILRESMTKYSRNSGYVVGGDSWSFSFLSEWTEEKELAIKESLEKNRLIAKLKHTDWNNKDLAELQSIHDLIYGESNE